MDELKKFTSTLESINSLSEQIMRKSLPIMKKMGDDKTFLHDHIKSKFPSLEEKDIKSKMKNISENLIKDSQTIKKELSTFIKNLLNNEINEELFLYQVWIGDMYGTEGYSAIKSLEDDLKTQLENCNINYIISNL